MAAKLVQSFASGLLVATTVVSAVYFFGPTEVISKQTDETPTVEEMKVLLNSEGYVVTTEEEINSMIPNDEIQTDDEMKSILISSGYVVKTEEEWQEQLEAIKELEKDNQKLRESADEKVVYRTMLTVVSGMTSIDVGQALVRANIIDRAMDLVNEVEKRGVANSLRPGTFEIDSNMNIDEIIRTVFK
ncbi:hypothetical protein BKP37_02800 [Anaerobacillus alkalilacustris]|uniref:Aminodeoxychorismate lyase n=1 Tax=Anaerobacillus alkalilacustris TaxID=393763 RepID=A0A1S2M176_9BACI|nr:hypothetical protein [Anaerobacillus alkalilacustris]OIJ17445.1 hypothetical protein BKP37_02800 [Anaerobacillus alkalilacustris]